MDQEKIGSFLKQLRKEQNISQEQLAEKFFVSVRTVSRWENGNTMPDISILIKLADFYNVDMRELLKGERKSDNMNDLSVFNTGSHTFLPPLPDKSIFFYSCNILRIIRYSLFNIQCHKNKTADR